MAYPFYLMICYFQELNGDSASDYDMNIYSDV